MQSSVVTASNDNFGFAAFVDLFGTASTAMRNFRSKSALGPLGKSDGKRPCLSAE